MKNKDCNSLYIYKQNATTHIESKKYSWAMVYLQDALTSFEQLVDTIETE